MQVTDIKHLVLSGGGLLGISYIGLAKFLEESLSNPIIKNFKSITGCSAGAIFGSLIAIGYTSTELQNIIKEMNFKEYININAESLINFMKLKNQNTRKVKRIKPQHLFEIFTNCDIDKLIKDFDNNNIQNELVNNWEVVYYFNVLKDVFTFSIDEYDFIHQSLKSFIRD